MYCNILEIFGSIPLIIKLNQGRDGFQAEKMLCKTMHFTKTVNSAMVLFRYEVLIVQLYPGDYSAQSTSLDM